MINGFWGTLFVDNPLNRLGPGLSALFIQTQVLPANQEFHSKWYHDQTLFRVLDMVAHLKTAMIILCLSSLQKKVAFPSEPLISSIHHSS